MEIKNLKPESNKKIIYIDDNYTSWVKLRKVQINNGGINNDDFDNLWLLKPTEKLKIKRGNISLECPRYTI